MGERQGNRGASRRRHTNGNAKGRKWSGPAPPSERLGAMFGVLVVCLSALAGASTVVGVASAGNTNIDSCTTIDSSGTHALSADIDVTQSDYTTRKSCIEINASDVTLDGNGHLVDGYSDNTFDNNGFPDTIKGSTGVRINGTDSTPLTNVTVRNVDFEGGNRGINATHAPGIELTEITVTDADLQGIGVRQTDGNVTLQNVETKNSPSLPDGDFNMESAVYLGSDTDSVLPDDITVSNLLVNDTEYPKKTSFGTPAVEAATEDGPLSVTDSNVTDTPRTGMELETTGGFSAGDVDVTNLSVSDFDRIGSDGHGLYVIGDADVTVNDTSVTGGGRSTNITENAIYIDNDNNDDVTVANSTIRNIYSDYGLQILADSSGTVQNVTVHNNTYRRGVTVSATDNLDVDDVIVTQTGERYAANLNGNTANIQDVSINDTKEGGLRNIDLDASTSLQDVSIANVSGTSPYGLDVDIAEGTYENVSVTDVGGRGIRFEENDDAFPDGTLTLANTSVENVSEYGIGIDGANIEINDTSVIDAGGDGIRKPSDSRSGTALDVTFRNVSVQNSGGKGIYLVEGSFDSLDTTGLTNVTVTNASGNGLQVESIAATLDGLDLPSATLDGTARSVVVDNVTATERPTPPSGKDDVGAHVEANNTTAAGYLNATVQYEDGDVPADLDESTLSMWRNDGSWSEVGGTVDTGANTVAANLTSFSVFAPLGDTGTASAASFDVTVDSTNSPVTEGETLTVDATVENTGNQQGTQDVNLSIDGTERDSTTVTLDSGNDSAVSLDWVTGSDDAGSYTATVESENDSASTSVTVNAPSTGGTPTGTLDVTVLDNATDDALENATVTVEHNGSTNATLTTDADGNASTELDTGDYTVTANASDYDEEDTSVSVAENDSATVTLRLDESDDENEQSNDSNTNRGGGGAPTATGTDGLDIDELPDVEETRDIADGVASFEGAGSLARVEFENADAAGSVTVKEYTNPPSAVVDSVADELGGDIGLRAVADVTPSDEDARQSSATVTFEIDDGRIDPGRTVVLHRTADGWTRVPTSVDTGRDAVSVAGELESFSVVAVAEEGDAEATPTPTAEPSGGDTPTPVDDTPTVESAGDSVDGDDTTPTAAQTVDDGTATETPTDTPGSSGPGFGVLIAVVAVAVSTLTLRRRT